MVGSSGHRLEDCNQPVSQKTAVEQRLDLHVSLWCLYDAYAAPT
jgi:hypothetical protein